MSVLQEEIPFIEQIHLGIIRRPFFRKYNSLYGEPILNIMRLKEELHRFSWGDFYFQIHKLGCVADTPPSIEIAVNLELVGLASRMLDNLVDEDDPRIEQRIGRANTLLLFTEILVESFGRLQRLVPGGSGEIQRYLMSALKGEWADVNHTALDRIVETEYMRCILPKSSSIFKLAAFCGNPNDMKFWDEFLDYASLALQLANDMAAIYAESKSDLRKLRPTLPMLKIVDVENTQVKSKRSQLMRAYAAGEQIAEEVRIMIEESGTLEYCYLIREIHKEKCREMLNEHFPDRLAQTKELFRLLQLEAL